MPARKGHGRGWGKRGTRYPVPGKLAIIRLVEPSHLPVRATLEKPGISRATFYRRYAAHRAAAPKPCRTPCPRIRFHDLQHSHATQMSTSGIHPKIAQERLGHSGIGIALDLYSRVMPGMQEDAAAKVDAAMRAAIDKAAG